MAGSRKITIPITGRVNAQTAGLAATHLAERAGVRGKAPPPVDEKAQREFDKAAARAFGIPAARGRTKPPPRSTSVTGSKRGSK